MSDLFDLENVREALRSHLPALSATFGLKPWDLEQLTLGELDTYLSALEAMERQQRKQVEEMERQMKRSRRA